MGPSVAIVGGAEPGRSYDPAVRDAPGAAAAAEELGTALALQGCTIVVYSSSQEFIEAAVVRGYVGSGHARPASIRVRGPYDEPHADFAEAQRAPAVFDVLPDATGDWEVSFYRSLLAVDAVLLIGGGRSTFIAGLIALSRRVPLAPVATFGGGAAKAWQRMRGEPNFATEDDLALTAAPWRPSSATEVVTSLVAQHARREQEQRRLGLESRRQDRRRTFGLLTGLALLLLALGTIPLTVAWQPGTAGATAILVAGPVLAAACGAITRSALDGAESWLRASVLGAAAGAVAFLLFVAAQLATNPNVLTGESARRLIFFVLAIGFTAGLGFDAVYAKLRSTDALRTDAIAAPSGPPSPNSAGVSGPAGPEEVRPGPA